MSKQLSWEGQIKEKKEDTKKSFWQEVFSWTKVIVIGVAAGLLLNHFVIQRNLVAGQSMEPTLEHGDQLVVERISTYLQNLDRGDIVTVDMTRLMKVSKKATFVKRIVAIPGDELEYKDGVLKINQKVVDEPYIKALHETYSLTKNFQIKLKLKEDEYYVLGDNRDNSRDSREFGPVKLSDIHAKLLVRIYPFDKMGTP